MFFWAVFVQRDPLSQERMLWMLREMTLYDFEPKHHWLALSGETSHWEPEQ